MKLRKQLLAILVCSLSTLNYANADDLDYYGLDSEDIELTPIEQQALALSLQIQEKQQIMTTEAGNGYIQYVYGAQKPSVVCSPLRVCDLSMQQGEHIISLFLGDSARWTLEPATVGEGGVYTTEHVIIKPLDLNIKTNLIITTDRRIYHVNLVSTRDKYMPQVSFVYPEEALAKFKAKQQQHQTAYNNATIPETGEYLGNLDFKYTITGDQTEWKPVRVYNDGKKTIIEMPETMNANEAPAFVVTRYNTNSSSNEQLVNYRVQNNKYIVDAVFFEGELIAGVGSNQDKVIIRREIK